MTEFEKTVLADLATLKTQMRNLIGNGQPGRIARIEARVERHEVFVERAGGIALLVGPLLAAVHILVDYIRR